MENQDHTHQPPEGGNNEAPAPVKAEVAAAAAAQQISLKVVNADGAEMFFKIKRGTQLKKLIDAYCKKQGISRGSVRFLFDGAPIDESKTPDDLGMEEDDVIDAMVEQTGGVVPVMNQRHMLTMVQLTRDDIHFYAKTMVDAVQTPAFQARVRAAVSRAPIPADTDAVMTRYEEVQADFLTNHHNTDTSVDACMNSRGDGANTSPAPKLDGVDIIEQLKKAVTVYKDAETEELITRLCLLIEEQVKSLIRTEPSLEPLTRHYLNGAQIPAHLAGGGVGGPQSFMNPSPQVKQMLSMAMSTLKPKQRETFERVQRTMMGGSQPTPEDMRELFLIQRQLGAFMQTMQKFGHAPGS